MVSLTSTTMATVNTHVPIGGVHLGLGRTEGPASTVLATAHPWWTLPFLSGTP